MEATQETPADVPTEAEVEVSRQETHPEADEEPRTSGEASVHLPDSSEEEGLQLREQRRLPGTQEASGETLLRGREMEDV